MSTGSELRPAAVVQGLLDAVLAVTPYDKRRDGDKFKGRIGDQPQVGGDRYVQVVPVGAQRNQRLLDVAATDLVVEVQLHYRNTVDNWGRAINDTALVQAALDQWTLAGVTEVRVALGAMGLATDSLIQSVIPVTVTFNLEGT
jgi:hypothetical protein